MISIIIPTLNEEKYLPKLLNSIKQQSFKDYEIIISDAKSNDNTLKIAKQYKTKIISSNPNISLQRNLGAKQAKGDILFFMDADTILPHNNFLKNITFLFKNPKITSITVKLKPTDKSFKAQFWFNLFHLVYKTCHFLGIPSGTGATQYIRKNIFNKINGFDEKMLISEDIDLLRRLNKHGKNIYYSKEFIFISTRRFDRHGYLKVIFLQWNINNLWLFLFNKPFMKKQEPVR